jgi:hypothetical protein
MVRALGSMVHCSKRELSPRRRASRRVETASKSEVGKPGPREWPHTYSTISTPRTLLWLSKEHEEATYISKHTQMNPGSHRGAEPADLAFRIRSCSAVTSDRSCQCDLDASASAYHIGKGRPRDTGRLTSSRIGAMWTALGRFTDWRKSDTRVLWVLTVDPAFCLA